MRKSKRIEKKRDVTKKKNENGGKEIINKKRLSVVMAGAMLASSVAPVLAEEVQNNNVELTAAQKGELAESLTRKIWNADRYCAKDVKAGQSIYGIQINDDEPIGFGADTTIATGSETKLLAAVKAALANLKVGDVVKLVNLGTDKRGEELYSQYVSTKYTEAEIIDAKGENNSIADQVAELKGFVKAIKDLDVLATVVEATEITSGGDTYKLRDLYDGLFLTEKGYELLNDAKKVEAILTKADKKNGTNNMDYPEYIVKVDGNATGSYNITKNSAGKYEATLEIVNPVKVAKQVENGGQWDANADGIYDKYTIVGDSQAELNTLLSWIDNRDAKVDVLAGEDRYATAVKIAKEAELTALRNSNGYLNGAFVVGTRGEADAMSIAGFAASKKAPVVVSGFGGLSEETVDALDGVAVNVIGGENVVSEADYEEVGAVAESIARVSGEDRKATNAAVINKFYRNSFRESESVIVAKDGMGNKGDLIDALTAANLAAKQNAPIVLGTKSLSKEQVHAVVQNAKTADKVYQVGHGVERNVVKVVAEALKLVNN